MYRLKILMILFLAFFLVGCDKPADTDATMPQDIFYGGYDSYEELETAFTSSDGDAVIAAENVELYGEEFKQFVDAIAQGDVQLIRPYLGQDLISLENKRGISIYSKSKWKRPDFFYHLMIADKGCTMTIQYLSEDELEYAKAHTLLETITYIYPEYGKSLKNWRWDFSVKKQATELWQLLDRQVETISTEFRDSTRIYKQFIYDNMYVTLRAEPEVFEDDIWSQFHLK